MKNSNYMAILFVVIVILTAYTMEKPKMKYSNSDRFRIAEQLKIDHFSVVIAQPGSKVTIMSPWPAVEYATCSLIRDKRYFFPPSFLVRNDTLFVSPISGKSEYAEVSFFCKGINEIVGLDKSEIFFYYLQADTLNLRLHNAKLLGDFDTRNKFLKQIYVQSDSSRINLKAVAFEDIHLQLNRSHVKLETSFVKSTVHGSIANFSGLYLLGHPKMALIKDSTSYSNL